MARSANSCLAALAAAALLCGCGSPARPSQGLVPLTVGSRTAHVEIASTPEKRAQGLMGRQSLGEDEGMLFVFPAEETASFWMKNTHIPLSIAFITKAGRIAEIQDMAPLSLETHSSREPVLMALEMSQGWFRRNGIQPGDIVVLPDEAAFSQLK